MVVLLSMGLIDSSNQLMSNAKHCLYISVGRLGRCTKLQSNVRFCFVFCFCFFQRSLFFVVVVCLFFFFFFFVVFKDSRSF